MQASTRVGWTTSTRIRICLAQPDEVYNLAAQSHVRVSFDMPIYTCDTDAVGSLKLLEAVRVFEV